MSSENVDDLVKRAIMLSEGIVPLDADEMHFDVNRILAKLPEEEARKMKRKYRKLWRRLAKNVNAEKPAGPDRERTSYHKRALVDRYINKKVKSVTKKK